METILDRVVEIEDYNGNTIMSFVVNSKGNIVDCSNMSVADIDNDYIYNTDKELIRLQQEENTLYTELKLNRIKEQIKERFIENYNTNHLTIDLMGLVDEDKLINYMIQEFNNDFMYGELFDIFNDYLNKETLKMLLEYMHHDFVDLDELEDEERDNYY